MTPQEIRELLAASAAIEPGPWEYAEARRHSRARAWINHPRGYVVEAAQPETARLIVALRALAPRLIDLWEAQGGVDIMPWEAEKP